jgi:uncharacterized membrane-anchored protein
MKSLINTLLFTVATFCLMPANAQQSSVDQFVNLNWGKAPNVAPIGSKANIKLTGSLLYLDEIETNKFLKITGNLPQTGSYTLYHGKEDWFAIFNFTDAGYVKDDEKIDADALLSALKKGNEAGQEQRKQQGLNPIYLEGWYMPPRYDSETKRLEWATKLKDHQNNPMVNFTTRILGRSGYMSATLVSDPQSLDRDIKSFKMALKDFDYVNGERYSEWRDGDKIAAYGLGALVVGGAAAAVASKGGFKFLGVIALAALAGLAAFFKKIFGRKQ